VPDDSDSGFIRDWGVVDSGKAHAPEPKLGHLHFTLRVFNWSDPLARSHQSQETCHPQLENLQDRISLSFLSQDLRLSAGIKSDSCRFLLPLPKDSRLQGLAVSYLEALRAELHPGHFAPFHLRIRARAGREACVDYLVNKCGVEKYSSLQQRASERTARDHGFDFVILKTVLDFWSIWSKISVENFIWSKCQNWKCGNVPSVNEKNIFFANARILFFSRI
jgi:hypothetical protein